MNLNTELWAIARNAALRVAFISNGRELFLYTNALYSAMLWGWREDIETRKKTMLEQEIKLTK